MICFLTTPTQAYEAYNLSRISVSDIRFVEKPLKVKNLFAPDFVKPEKVETADMCRIAIDEVEEEFNIKKNLLHTIASVESGRFVKARNKRLPWPWTVHANGKGYYFKTKQEAVDAVKSMQANGLKNIDVGCMQINLRYHGNNFSSLEDAFEPKKNVSYSASFLKKLHKRTANWAKTAMHYHSKNASKGAKYKARLEKHFAKYVAMDNGGSTIALF